MKRTPSTVALVLALVVAGCSNDSGPAVPKATGETAVTPVVDAKAVKGQKSRKPKPAARPVQGIE